MRPKKNFDQAIGTPLNVIFKGEQNKWTAVSKQRFKNIDIDEKSIKLSLIGTPNERLEMAYTVSSKLMGCTCIVPASGRTELIITVNDYTC